jgi:response regulator RpfG family c-di-GMP phosphodiesterase
MDRHHIAGCADVETEKTFFALAQAVEQRDLHTASHCERVAFISVAMGMISRLDENELQILYCGGYIYDIGKVGIPDSILFKPGKLTVEEWEVRRTHTTRGVEICRHVESLAPVVPIIRHHHERWDGSGLSGWLGRGANPVLGAISAGRRYLRCADQPASVQRSGLTGQGVAPHPPRNGAGMARSSGGGVVFCNHIRM